MSDKQWKVGDQASVQNYDFCFDEGATSVTITAIGENVALIKQAGNNDEFPIRISSLLPPLTPEEIEAQSQIRKMVDDFRLEWHRAEAMYNAGYRKVRVD